MIQDDGVSVPDRATAAEPKVSDLRDGIANALSDADTIALLRSDLRKLAAGDEVATGCEGCGAMLLRSDDYCSDFHGSGCWWLVTGGKWGQSPCYAYRVASQTNLAQADREYERRECERCCGNGQTYGPNSGEDIICPDCGGSGQCR